MVMLDTQNRAPLGDTIAHSRAPTLSDILGLLDRAKRYYDPFHAQCAEEENYYFLRKATPHPPDADPTRPATARAIVDVATDHVDVRNLSIDVPLMRRSKARAERLKKFYQGVWDNIRAPVLRTSVKHQFLYGISWKKTMFNADLWYDAPHVDDYGVRLDNGEILMVREDEYKEALKEHMERRKLTFPFVVENVNPTELMWDDSRTGPKWVLRVVDTTAGVVREKYADWESRKRDNDPAMWIEYWDDTFYAYLADNSFVLDPQRHGYGFLNYSMSVPAHAIDWDAGKPEDRYQGILRPVHQLLDAEARLVTQIEAIIRKHAWPGIDFGGPAHAAEETRAQYERNGLNVVLPNVVIAPSPVPNVPPDIFRQLERVQTMIEEATFPNVVRGLRPSGVSSGFGISVMSGQGRLRFSGVADGEARSIEKCNMHFAMLIENRIRDSVTVHGRSEVHDFDETIKPDDIKGYYENTVKLKAEAPEEREREALLAVQLFQAGIISKYEAQRRAGVVNPLEEQEQQAAEQVLEAMRPAQVEQLQQELAGNLLEQKQQAAGPVNKGNQFVPGMPQLQRPGERGIQQARSASQQGRPSVFPQGAGGVDILGSIFGTPTGGAQTVPSGQRVGG